MAAMSDDGSTETRVTELEVRSEFVKQSVEELDTVLREFTQRVTRLEEEFAELRTVLESMRLGA